MCLCSSPRPLISSLRDVGYNNTTSAICKHVDNAIQAKATEVRIFFRQTGKKGDTVIDAAVYDNGQGMAPNVLKVATSFGGSMTFNNRAGIGRFGMGMKTAALSMSPIMDLYSWQDPHTYYSMTLDVDAIGRERTNTVELPDPTLMTELPSELADLFSKPLSFPASANDQSLMLERGEDLDDRLGGHGTIIYMPTCDRLTYATARTLVEHAMKEIARVYRRAIEEGLKLYVNNRLVEAFDPTYAMAGARHVRFPRHPGKDQPADVRQKDCDPAARTWRGDRRHRYPPLSPADRAMVDARPQDPAQRPAGVQQPDRYHAAQRSRGLRRPDDRPDHAPHRHPLVPASRSTSRASWTRPSASRPTSRACG